MATIEEYFQQAKDGCIGCFYAYNDIHIQNDEIVFTTNNPRDNRDKARKNLKEVVEMSDVYTYEAQIASQTLGVCNACFRSFCRKKDGKPCSKGIVEFLQKESIKQRNFI